jgi:hypothetical protein
VTKQIICVFLFAILGCEADTMGLDCTPTGQISNDECLKRGGVPDDRDICACPTSDDGKQCSSGGDCEGRCFAASLGSSSECLMEQGTCAPLIPYHECGCTVNAVRGSYFSCLDPAFSNEPE